MEARKQSEIDFHNKREHDRKTMGTAEFEAKYSNKKWYSVTRRSRDSMSRWLKEHCKDGVVLDYCCGLGGASLQLAEAGAAFVHGIDISDESVETARGRLQDAGFGETSRFQVMDAEALEFEDDTFDAILCSGVLHHLDVGRAFPQLARVLKPGGRILCAEALGYNPAITLYRKLTPDLRTEWEADHILTLREVDQARQWFDGVDIRFFHLASIGGVLFRKTPVFGPVLSALELVDDVLLRVPGVQRMAWQMHFELTRPKKPAAC